MEFIIKNSDKKMLVDDDFKLPHTGGVYLDEDGYPFINYKGKKKPIHRMIMNAHKGQIVDHINRNPLDNRRENLRFANISQSGANRRRVEREGQSQYKGVFIETRLGGKYTYYTAKLRKDGEIFKKTFKNEIEAAKWYDEMAYKLHGEYAYRNFPLQ